METIKTSQIEEMGDDDFNTLKSQVETAKSTIQSTTDAGEVKSQICDVWGKIRKFVILAEAFPGAGKYIKILVELLDSICAA